MRWRLLDSPARSRLLLEASFRKAPPDTSCEYCRSYGTSMPPRHAAPQRRSRVLCSLAGRRCSALWCCWCALWSRWLVVVSCCLVPPLLPLLLTCLLLSMWSAGGRYCRSSGGRRITVYSNVLSSATRTAVCRLYTACLAS